MNSIESGWIHPQLLTGELSIFSLCTLATPSLLIIGDVKGIVSPVVAAELARLNQRLEVVQIEEAGYGIPYDQPERFSTAVKAFLRSANF